MHFEFLCVNLRQNRCRTDYPETDSVRESSVPNSSRSQYIACLLTLESKRTKSAIIRTSAFLYLDCFALEEATDKFSRIVGYQLPIYTA
jgi:hypothetical protein